MSTAAAPTTEKTEHPEHLENASGEASEVSSEKHMSYERFVLALNGTLQEEWDMSLEEALDRHATEEDLRRSHRDFERSMRFPDQSEESVLGFVARGYAEI